jgi:hypothetical protein
VLKGAIKFNRHVKICAVYQVPSDKLNKNQTALAPTLFWVVVAPLACASKKLRVLGLVYVLDVMKDDRPNVLASEFVGVIGAATGLDGVSKGSSGSRSPPKLLEVELDPDNC